MFTRKQTLHLLALATAAAVLLPAAIKLVGLLTTLSTLTK